jgi:alpha-beta hydrolase superfamily lysophospholipase
MSMSSLRVHNQYDGRVALNPCFAANAIALLLVLLGVLQALGCASHPLLTKPPMAPPDHAIGKQTTTWLKGAQETRLYFATAPPDGEPRGVIFFVLGPEISSFDSYPRLTAALRASGVATAVIHPRGTGFSDGLRGDIEDYSLFVDDLQLGLAQTRETFPGKPIFVFGHSAGAALALDLAVNQQKAIAGVILVNPAYKLTYADGMGPTFSDYVSFAFNSVFRRSALSVDMNSNPAAVRNANDRAEGIALQRDPLVVRYFSMRYLSAQRELMSACATNAAKLNAPLLLVQGEQDALVDPRGTDEILAAAHTNDKVKLVAPHGGHGSSAVETMVVEVLRWLRIRR